MGIDLGSAEEPALNHRYAIYAMTMKKTKIQSHGYQSNDKLITDKMIESTEIGIGMTDYGTKESQTA